MSVSLVDSFSYTPCKEVAGVGDDGVVVGAI